MIIHFTVKENIVDGILVPNPLLFLQQSGVDKIDRSANSSAAKEGSTRSIASTNEIVRKKGC